MPPQGTPDTSETELTLIRIQPNSISKTLVLEQECGYTQLLIDAGVHVLRHNLSAIGRASTAGVTRELEEGRHHLLLADLPVEGRTSKREIRTTVL